jgi:UTP--glucose-1-phosphate uridylyltransferase
MPPSAVMISTALIPAAGRGLKPYPVWDSLEKLLAPIIDADGTARPLLLILLEEAAAAGCARVVLVVGPGEELAYRRSIGWLAETMRRTPDAGTEATGRRLAELAERLAFAVQDQPLGFGHAVWSARDRVEGGRFVLLMADHLHLALGGHRCAAQVVAAAGDGCASAVMPVPEHDLHRFGVVLGQPIHGRPGMWTVQKVREKPTPTLAELELETPGLPRGRYLAFSGIHVLPTAVFAALDRRIAARAAPGWNELSPVLDELAATGEYRACELDGMVQDIGTRFGLLRAQLERALAGPDRDEVLRLVLEVVARGAR